ncbi:MAG: hypothetical protein LQ344_003001 [Seirophora lacunosa]|nr:MAG: hypothetical protein LQ344_003001 [Seirophora lacunosa]
MPDLSQFDVPTNPEDFGALGGNVPHGLSLMDIDVEDQPDTVAAFNSYPPVMTSLSAAENQQQWAAIGLEQVRSPAQYPNPDTSLTAPLVLGRHSWPASRSPTPIPSPSSCMTRRQITKYRGQSTNDPDTE